MFRKFVLESEAGDKAKALWPWYCNTLHADQKCCDDIDNYRILIQEFNFDKMWSINEIKHYLTSASCNINQTTYEPMPIRFKWKFAAQLLLTPHEITRQINLLRNQLQPLLTDIAKSWRKSVDEKEEKKEHQLSKTKSVLQLESIKKEVVDLGKDLQASMVDYCNEIIAKDETFWPKKIKETNEEFKVKKDRYLKMESQQDKYGLFDENIDNLKTLNMYVLLLYPLRSSI